MLRNGGSVMEKKRTSAQMARLVTQSRQPGGYRAKHARYSVTAILPFRADSSDRVRVVSRCRGAKLVCRALRQLIVGKHRRESRLRGVPPALRGLDSRRCFLEEGSYRSAGAVVIVRCRSRTCSNSAIPPDGYNATSAHA